MEDLKAGRAIARRYRNRRIGEFLKEIDLSEKKSTGITKILRALKANGSPLPEFETDSDRNYFIVTIYPHEAFEPDEVTNDGINEVINEALNRQSQIINAMKEKPNITINQLAVRTGISKTTIERAIHVMKKSGIVKRVGSNKAGCWEITE